MTDDMAPVFRALADPGRRVLLDRLFERDGQTLGELCVHLPAMTRFGVMKHLGVLEEAGLVTTQRVGREKRHFLNPVPIRLVHDRWTGKFAESIAGSLKTIKMQLETPMDRIDHVYSIYIKATPERVWRAITDGDDTLRYYYGTRVSSDWHARLDADLRLPRRLARRRRRGPGDRPGSLGGDVVPAALGPRHRGRRAGPHGLAGRGTDDGGSRLTVTSALIPGSKTEADFSGGVVYIVSGLKTFLETGAPLAAAVG